MPTYKDEITYYRGDFYPQAVALFNAEDNTPIDLTGAVLTMTVDRLQSPKGTDSQLFQLVGVVEEPDSGYVYFTPTADNTDMSVGTYWYDISMVVGTVSKRTVKKNKFIIMMDINKD